MCCCSGLLFHNFKLQGNAFTNDEYRRLLAVAWGQAEPEDDEDEDDEDFVSMSHAISVCHLCYQGT